MFGRRLDPRLPHMQEVVIGYEPTPQGEERSRWAAGGESCDEEPQLS